MPALLDLKQSLARLQQVFYRLKDDLPLQAELRHLGLGLLVCFAVAYGGRSLFIEPQQRKIQKQLLTQQPLKSAAAGEITPMLDTSQRQLNEELRQIQEEKAILDLKNRLLDEQWLAWGDVEHFTQLTMALDPAAPVSLEKILKKLSHLDPQLQENFIVYPINLNGVASFQDLLTYLRYLEDRPEVGMIDDLILELVPVEGTEKSGKIAFSLTVGRVTPKLQETK